MKKVLVPLTVFALCLISIAGCCERDRDVATPARALLGHWRNIVPGGNPDLYFSDSEVTFDRNGDTYSTSYSIEKEDEKGFYLNIIYRDSSDVTKITFSKDRNTITVMPENIPELLRYEYVDSQQKP